MAQEMISKYLTIAEQIKLRKKVIRISKKHGSCSKSTQTDYYNFSLFFGNSKKIIKFYFSKRLRDYVLSFNIGSKCFILNRNNWGSFSQYFEDINFYMGNKKI